MRLTDSSRRVTATLAAALCLALLGSGPAARGEEPILVRNINRGSEGSRAASFVRVGGEVFFAADDGLHGQVLWRTDGTVEGTTLVKDITPGKDHSLLGEFAVLGTPLLRRVGWSGRVRAPGDSVPKRRQRGGYEAVRARAGQRRWDPAPLGRVPRDAERRWPPLLPRR